MITEFYHIQKIDGLHVWFRWVAEPEFRIKGSGFSYQAPEISHRQIADCEKSFQVAHLLELYFKQEVDPLPVGFLELALLSQFQGRILCQLRKQVPSGKVISYGQLATMVGKPRAARAVGSVMSHNPFPLFFPCHRVVRTNGQTGFFQGGPSGTDLKREILAREGISFTPAGKISSECFL